MAMNNMESLADFMFEEMERLNDIEVSEDNDKSMELLDAEIKRAKAFGTMTQAIVSAGRTVIEAKRFQAEYAGVRSDTSIPKMLQG